MQNSPSPVTSPRGNSMTSPREDSVTPRSSQASIHLTPTTDRIDSVTPRSTLRLTSTFSRTNSLGSAKKQIVRRAGGYINISPQNNPASPQSPSIKTPVRISSPQKTPELLLPNSPTRKQLSRTRSSPSKLETLNGNSLIPKGVVLKEKHFEKAGEPIKECDRIHESINQMCNDQINKIIRSLSSEVDSLQSNGKLSDVFGRGSEKVQRYNQEMGTFYAMRPIIVSELNSVIKPLLYKIPSANSDYSSPIIFSKKNREKNKDRNMDLFIANMKSKILSVFTPKHINGNIQRLYEVMFIWIENQIPEAMANRKEKIEKIKEKLASCYVLAVLGGIDAIIVDIDRERTNQGEEPITLEMKLLIQDKIIRPLQTLATGYTSKNDNTSALDRKLNRIFNPTLDRLAYLFDRFPSLHVPIDTRKKFAEQKGHYPFLADNFKPVKDSPTL